MADPTRLDVRVHAPLSAVRTALTDPTALRTWLAEHADVEPPDKVEFWGRYTPEGDAPRQRLLRADDDGLRFAWRVGGEDTTVEISLAEEGAEATTVTLTQSHPDADGVLRGFWALALANLVDHVEGRDLTPMCDYTSTDPRVELFIHASPDEVHRSLVDPEAWFGAPVRVVAAEPGRVEWDGGVVAESAESGDGTKVVLTRSGTVDHGAWSEWLAGIAELRRYHELAAWRAVAVDGPPPAR
ncbi:SRPBCC domain-containing protein [Umezawaea sp. NPDC059074]|uniref:SRPBCC domain-containing protein n=1 Tax=Umezawaea sp. NPDC059074 TaxID=3346716 RepID=UPI0036A2EC4F